LGMISSTIYYPDVTADTEGCDQSLKFSTIVAASIEN